MNIRKLAAFTAIALCVLSCGCDKKEEVNRKTKSEAFIYEEAGNVSLMTAAGDTLYTIEQGENFEALLNAFDAEGNKTSTVVIEDYQPYDIKGMCAGGDNIYIAASVSGGYGIFGVDKESGALNELVDLSGINSVSKIDIFGGKIYWLVQKTGAAKPLEPLYDEEGVYVYFYNSGLKLGCYDIESKELEESLIEFPISFAVSPEGVTVYAFDAEKGYYFTDYDNPEEKRYTNKLGSITNFEIFKETGEFAFIGSDNYGGTLSVSKADEKSGVIRAVNNVYTYFPYDICANENGSVWIKTSETVYEAEKRIKRYDLSDNIITGNPVRIISCQYYPSVPYSEGSEAELTQLNEEGFALTVLSLDKNYDAAMISSDLGIANDIKEKGSFYPLNEVEGVMEYLDKCFPYIKEAVTDDNGSICMLPVILEIPVMAYNEKNCEKNNLKFSPDLGEVIDTVKRASEISENYDFTNFWIIKNQINGYLAENSTFNTDEFREMAKLLKDGCTEDVFRSNFNLYSAALTLKGSGYADEFYSGIYEDSLFLELLYHDQQMLFIDNEDFGAAALPASGNGKNIAICTFICVNPYSDRLNETLGYIENLAYTLSEERNSCMLKDKGTYDETKFAGDLYSIYENGQICFQIPAEIYSDDFESYRTGKITLEDFITEADRKLSAYLNE